MKKVIAWLLVLALTAAVSIGATLAYLTDTDEDVNVMTLGKVKIDQLEYERIDVESTDDDATVQEFHDNKPLLPAVTEDGFDYATGDTYVDWEQIGKDGYTSDIWDPTKINNEVDKMVFVKNKGTYDAYVRTVFAFEAGKYTTLDEFNSMVHLNLNEEDWTWEWAEKPVTIGESTYFIATATYNNVLEPGAYTEISLSQISLDKTATNEDVEAFGETYQVLVKSQAIQADGFADPVAALDEGFGAMFTNIGTADAPVLEVNDTAIPFADDNPIRGTDLKTALRNLNGDANQSIVTQVASVTYALNSEYPSIVGNYDGTLVDVEQDVPVYVYYVPNGGQYDIYCLADDVIYSPAASNGLYNGMTALKSVDTHNYDSSRAETMRTMFQSCTSLKTLDTTEWDTSKVADMTGMFNGCSSLVSVEGTENWDLSSCTSMYGTFMGCSALQTVDATGWDVSGVASFRSLFSNCSSLTDIIGEEDWDMSGTTTTNYMFSGCSRLVSLDTADWDLSNNTDMYCMFQNCRALEELDTSKWDTADVTNMQFMFAWCHKLNGVDVSGWDTSKVTNFYAMFYQAYKVPVLDVANWDTGSATNMAAMFAGCTTLKTLNTGNWDTSNVTDMSTMFSNSTALESVDVSNWDMSKVKTTRIMFQNCTALKELDTSKWNTGSLTTMEGMFNHCEVITKIDVSDWDVSKVTSFGAGFQSCFALKELDVSNWDTSSATAMGWMFWGCNSIELLDVSNWDVSNVTVMSHMFRGCNSLLTMPVDNWDVSKVESMDALFHSCRSLTTINVSNWDTGNVREFSQMFEGDEKLVEIVGMGNWDTSNARTFDETFSYCYALKELDLSSFDTRNVTPGFKAVNGDKCRGFEYAFIYLNSLEKLIIGPNVVFNGNGTVAEGHQIKLPDPAPIDGVATKWYNAENDTYYDASEIPDRTAATYVAKVPPVTP